MAIKQYFSHDVNAFNDPKIVIMVDDWGIVSYAYWWTLIEDLASEETNTIKLNNLTFRYYAKKWGIDKSDVEQFIKALISDYELLATDDGLECWSESLNRRIEKAEQTAEAKRKMYSEMGKRSAAKRKAAAVEASKNDVNENSTHVEPTLNHVETTLNLEQQKKRKENKIKEKKIKEIKENKEKKINSVDFYLNNVGQLSSLNFQKLIDLVNDFGDENTLKALKYAHSMGKASMGYITKVLENQAQELATKATTASGNKYPVINIAEMENEEGADDAEH